MTPLNVDIPTETNDLLRLAKALTKKPIRIIAQEALEAWLKQNGITREAMNKIRPK